MASNTADNTANSSVFLAMIFATEAEARSVPTLAESQAAADLGVDWIARLTADGDLTEALDDWRERLDTWNRRGERVALLADPRQARALLALIRSGAPFDSVIHEHEGYLAGTGTRVLRLERQREDPVDIVINATTRSVDDVRAMFDQLGLAPRVYALA